MRVKGAINIFDFLLEAIRRGEKTALITITHVIGSSSRAPGAHLALSETGAFRGSISGGCVEAALVGLGQRAIVANKPGHVRLGTGSPYIDIRLPCGGGLDLQITPNPAFSAVARICERLQQRQPVCVALSRDGRLNIAHDVKSTGWLDDVFYVRHEPELRLVIIGRGSETEALARISAAYGTTVDVLTPDETTANASRRYGAKTWHLLSPSPSPHLVSDRHTAMGSKQTHARRLGQLRSKGVPEDLCCRIVGPVGLIHAARDPDTLALSILSQVVEAYRVASTVSAEIDPLDGNDDNANCVASRNPSAPGKTSPVGLQFGV
jgi:xanthine dehydrogenase accessory factor